MRTKKVYYNALSGIIPQIILGILGFIKIRFFINVLGIELNGLMQLFAQIFSYLALAEGGISAAIQYRLYKLLLKKDYKKINELLKGSKITFRKIAYSIIFIALVLAIRLDIFINNNPFDLLYIQIAFILYLVSTIISYFYISDRILLSSDQKLYKINIIFNSAQILKTILEIVMILLGTNIFMLIILGIIINIISFNILKKIVRNEYSWYSDKEVVASFDFKKDIRHLLPHKITNTVSKSTDMIVISTFLGIKEVGIYGAYNYIVSFFVQIIDQISSAFFSIIGNYNAEESSDKVHILFNHYSVFMMIAANIICIPLMLTFNNFIQLWVGEKMLVDFITMLLFVFILYYRIIMVPLGTFVSVNGLFKETKISSYIEASINLILSIILVNIYGIKGVLIGTVISLVTSSLIYYPIILYKKIFNNNVRKYYIFIIKNFLISLVLYYSQFSLAKLLNFKVDNFILWFAYGIMIFIVNLILTIIIYKNIFTEDYYFILSKITKKVKK